VVARAAYVELCRRYDGANNGRIAMSARDLAARLKCSKDTAARALRELEDAGFITTVKIGTFSRKNRLASEYRLNLHPCDVTGAPPDRRWNATRWRPDGPTRRTSRSDIADNVPRSSGSRSEMKDRRRQNGHSHSPTTGTHLDSSHGGRSLSGLLPPGWRRQRGRIVTPEGVTVPIVDNPLVGQRRSALRWPSSKCGRVKPREQTMSWIE
jgi:DNA-binding transcriptional MocR family regulator